MKKLLLATLIFTLAGLTVQAQNCSPDPMLADTTAGVYPLPDPVGSATSSLATGCVNTAYSQLFTAVVPDSIAAPIGGVEVTVELISVEVLDITGLPDGVTYACEPADCKFTTATSPSCVVFTGTPTTAGTFKPIVSTEVVTSLITLPVNFPSQPGDVLPDIFPGEYVVNVLEAGDAACPVGTENPLDDVLGVSQNVPNPFNTTTSITIDSRTSGQFDFKVYSLIGEMVHNESLNLSVGENIVTFDGTNLNSGMYFYSIGQDGDVVTKRMVVSQ